MAQGLFRIDWFRLTASAEAAGFPDPRKDTKRERRVLTKSREGKKWVTYNVCSTSHAIHVLGRRRRIKRHKIAGSPGSFTTADDSRIIRTRLVTAGFIALRERLRDCISTDCSVLAWGTCYHNMRFGRRWRRNPSDLQQLNPYWVPAKLNPFATHAFMHSRLSWLYPDPC
jgi:hypothetical protein